MSVPFTVIALYPYPLADQEPAEDDLSFNAKQLITVTTIPDDDWYCGSYTDSNGQYHSGFFPQSFVKIHTEPTQASTSEVAPTKSSTVAAPEPVSSPVAAAKTTIPEPVASTGPPAPQPGASPTPFKSTTSQSPVAEKFRHLKETKTELEESMIKDERFSPSKLPEHIDSNFKNKLKAFNVSAAPPLPGQMHPDDKYSKQKPFSSSDSHRSSYIPPMFGTNNEKKHEVRQPVPTNVISETSLPKETEEDAAPRMTLKQRMQLLEEQRKKEEEAIAAAEQRKLEKKKKLKKRPTETHGESPLETSHTGHSISTSHTGHSISANNTGSTQLTESTEGYQQSIEGDTEQQGSPTETAHLETKPEPVYEEEDEVEEDDDNKVDSEEDNDDDNEEGDDDEEGDEDDEEDEEDEEELKKRQLRERMAKLSGGMGMMGMMGGVGFGLPGMGGPTKSAETKKKIVKKSKTNTEESEEMANLPKAIPILPFANPQALPGLASQLGKKPIDDEPEEEDESEEEEGERHQEEELTKNEEEDEEESDSDEEFVHPSSPQAPKVPEANPIAAENTDIKHNHPYRHISFSEAEPVSDHRGIDADEEDFEPESGHESFAMPHAPPPKSLSSSIDGDSSSDETPIDSKDINEETQLTNTSPIQKELGDDRFPDNPHTIPISRPTAQPTGYEAEDEFTDRNSSLMGSPGRPSEPTLYSPQRVTNSNATQTTTGLERRIAPIPTESATVTSPTKLPPPPPPFSAIPPIPGSAPPIPGSVPPIPSSVPPIPGSVPPIPAPVPASTVPIPRVPKGSEHTSHHGPGSAPPPPPSGAAPPVPRAATVHSESRRPSTNSSIKRRSTSSQQHPPPPIPSQEAPPIPFQEPPYHHTAPPPPPPSAPAPLAPPPAVPGDILIAQTSGPDASHKSIHNSALVMGQTSGHMNSPFEDPRIGRSSMEASRASPSANSESFSQGQRLSEYMHGNYGDWWVARKLPADPKFKDVLYEISSFPKEKRCSRSVLYLDYYILNKDYSQIIWEISCDANHPENILSYSETLLPTPSASQEYLKKASSTYGPKIIELAKAAQKTSLKQEFISWIFDQLPPKVLRNVGKSYGTVIYRNIDNKDFRNYDKIRPGDIFSAIHAKFESRSALHKKSFELGSSRQPHMAVISEFDKIKNKFRVVEQDSRGVVQESSYKLSDMKSGRIEVFRVVGRNYVGW